jgi:LacI family transcriptional regulator
MDIRRSNFSKSPHQEPGAGAQRGAPRGARSLTRIAAEAGVSVSAVSKVLNGRSDVAPQTRERVGRLLRDEGYKVAPLMVPRVPGTFAVPGTGGSGQAGSGMGVVDLLVGAIGSPWADELIRGTVTAAAETDISVIVSRVTSAAEFERWLGIATVRGTIGVLSVLYLPDEAMLAALDRAHVPLVVIDPPVEPAEVSETVRSVGTTNWQAGLTVTRYLIELGHERIAAIGGPERLWSCRARLDGYRSARHRAGLPDSEALVRSGELTAEDGRRLAGSLLDLAEPPGPPTAIVTGNDAQAFGALQALAERGLRAPADVSVTGFDDTPIATWSAPPLTTVRQPLAAMAATAFWMLTQDPAADASVHARHVELETTLVIRDSTAPPAR